MDELKDSEVIEKTILRIKRKFQEGIQNEKKLKYLQQLSQLPITLSILKSTGIGKLVSKLRQEDSPISDKAEHLVVKWKQLASVEKAKTPEKLKAPSASSTSTSSLLKQKNIKVKQSHEDSMEAGEEEEEKEEASFSSSNARVSFGDLMMMSVPDVNKKKKKKKKETDLLRVPLPATIDLPSISDTPGFKPVPVYKPTRSIPELPKTEKKPKENYIIKKDATDYSSVKTRSTMYSGKRSNLNGVVPSLYNLSMKVLVDNIDALYETGGVPFSILAPVLSKCTPSQLQRLEYYNEYILEDSDVLWKTHCQNEFKGKNIRKDVDESWRDTYARMCEEREERLRRLSTKITASQASKVPERSVKLAYIAGAPKGSVQSMRKQKRYGTDLIGDKKKELIARIDKEQRSTAEVAIPFANIPRRDRCSIRPPSSLSSTSRHNIAPAPKKGKDDLGSQGPSRLMPNAIKKPGKKPMMAAALKMLKNQKGRVNSQIIRR